MIRKIWVNNSIESQGISICNGCTASVATHFQTRGSMKNHLQKMWTVQPCSIKIMSDPVRACWHGCMDLNIKFYFLQAAESENTITGASGPHGEGYYDYQANKFVMEDGRLEEITIRLALYKLLFIPGGWRLS